MDANFLDLLQDAAMERPAVGSRWRPMTTRDGPRETALTLVDSIAAAVDDDMADFLATATPEQVRRRRRPRLYKNAVEWRTSINVGDTSIPITAVTLDVGQYCPVSLNNGAGARGAIIQFGEGERATGQGVDFRRVHDGRHVLAELRGLRNFGEEEVKFKSGGKKSAVRVVGVVEGEVVMDLSRAQVQTSCLVLEVLQAVEGGEMLDFPETSRLIYLPVLDPRRPTKWRFPPGPIDSQIVLCLELQETTARFLSVFRLLTEPHAPRRPDPLNDFSWGSFVTQDPSDGVPKVHVKWKRIFNLAVLEPFPLHSQPQVTFDWEIFGERDNAMSLCHLALSSLGKPTEEGEVLLRPSRKGLLSFIGRRGKVATLRSVTDVGGTTHRSALLEWDIHEIAAGEMYAPLYCRLQHDARLVANRDANSEQSRSSRNGRKSYRCWSQQ